MSYGISALGRKRGGIGDDGILFSPSLAIHTGDSALKIVSFDIEANGLLYTATKTHCICMYDNQEKEYSFSNEEYKKALVLLDTYDLIVGHNICGYDLPLLEKLYGWTPKSKVLDTHILSRLNEPDRPQGHSIEAYAKQFGMEKVGADIEDWATLTDYMLDRCKNDAKVGWKTFEYLNKRMGLGYELLG